MKKNFLGFIFTFLLVTTFVTAEYHSQAEQDRYLNEHFFHGKRNGVFLDIGAYDGITISNSYFFEEELGWKGLCIEPMPRAFKQLKFNRSCEVLNCLVGSYNGTASFLEIDAKDFPELAMLSGEQHFFDEARLAAIESLVAQYHGKYQILPMPIKKLNDILYEHQLFDIDYLSIDIEGNELDVLSALDFDIFRIHVMTVENNARETNQQIRLFMESKGFRFVIRLEQDEVYENTHYKGT